MVITVNLGLCAGCGVCIEECSVGAIQLVDQRAAIDSALCTQCEACVDVCPHGAITAILEPAPLIPALALTVTETQTNLMPTRAALPLAQPSNQGLATWAGTAFTFLRREVAPLLVDVLATALERRLTAPVTRASSSLSAFPKTPARMSRGIRRQTRYRGGRFGNRIPKERR
jgi:NAD-dependent dihydropyrimidine dehydrogenase PreA subunit